MNDKLLMENMLLVLKSTVEVYVHGTLESSNKKIRDTLKYGLDNIMDMQFDLYNKMTENNWYNIENISTNVIENTITKLKNKENN